MKTNKKIISRKITMKKDKQRNKLILTKGKREKNKTKNQKSAKSRKKVIKLRSS